MITRQTLLNNIKEHFIKAGLDNPASHARTCLSYALNISASQLIAFPEERVEQAKQDEVLKIAKRMSAHEPFAYITGTREFWGRDFDVSPATLIPRHDTETLIQKVLSIHSDSTQAFKILDLGTGSGCVLLTLLAEYPNAQGLGIDISDDALEIAKKNAQRLNLVDRVQWLKSEWLQALSNNQAKKHTQFDIIVSNPPYIPSADITHLDQTVRDYEPLTALDGGNSGLDAYRVMIPQALEYLIENGVFACEIGIGQAQAVEQLCHENGLITFAPLHDLSGTVRVVGGTKNMLGFSYKTR